MKKFATLLVAVFATTALWAFRVDSLYYRVTSDTVPYTVAVTHASSSGNISHNLTSAIIPETVTNNGITYTVTSIGHGAFRECHNLTSITIPKSVTIIEYAWFDRCQLQKVNYTGDVQGWINIKMEGNPIYYSKNLYINDVPLTDLVIPDGVTEISTAFAYDTCITSVTIPESVTNIGAYAFAECSGLTSITIPNSVTTIGDHAFSGCSGLTAATIGSSVTSIGSSAFASCTGLSTITIPNSVTTIGDHAFSGCSGLTAATIGSGVTSIGNSAFASCTGLTTITIPNSVTSIGSSVFGGCTNLAHLAIPSSVTSAASEQLKELYALDSISVPAMILDVEEAKWVYQPKKLRYIEVNSGELTTNAFAVIQRSYKTLQALDMDRAENTAITDEAFKDFYNLQQLVLPAALQKVPYMAVAGCKTLQAISIPATVEEVDNSAFEDCRSIKSITFEGATNNASGAAQYAPAAGSALRRIGNWAFYNNHELQNLTIPEGVTEIGDAAFYGCTYLQDMVLPSSVRSIGDNAFALCSKLTKITVNSTTPPEIQPKTFEDVNRTIPVYVPMEAVEDYLNDPYWSEFNIQGVEPTAIENVQQTAAFFAENGRIVCDDEFQIFDLLGRNVTRLNGSLNGVYIVKVGEKAQKVVVK